MKAELSCWCGNNTRFVPFSEDYFLCPVCQTLIWRGETDESVNKGQDEEDYYNFNYWLEHQNELGLPDIHTRVRTDFIDRIPYWASMILKYKLPPGKTIDVGSSHGGLVAFLKNVGFEAIGLEVSPKLAEYSQEVFGVTTMSGFIEDQKDLKAATFDILSLMDVIEHLENPMGTLQHCAGLLKDNGLLVIQTPAYPENQTYSFLKSMDHPFLKMMIPREHRYLFSKRSLQKFLRQLGFEEVRFEQALFDYDMFCFASKQTLSPVTNEQITATLMRTPSRRFSLALIELFRERDHWLKNYLQADNDRVERLKAIDQGAKITASLKDRVRELESQVRFLNEQFSPAQRRIKAFEELITILQNSSSYKLLRKLNRLSWFDQKTRQLMAAPPIAVSNEDIRAFRDRDLKLAIDLTPIRPGGENGGAKIMALNMIRQWSETLAPDWEYILLTSEVSHEELAWLDRENVKRICVNFNASEPQPPTQSEVSLRSRVRKVYEERVPVTWRLRLGYSIRNATEEKQAGSLLKKIGADLLFCPFTAPFYYDPEVPIVLVVYDLQYKYYPSFFTPEDVYHTERYFQKSVEVANRLICISEHTRMTVLENTNIDPYKVNFIQTCLFKPLMQVDEARILQITNKHGLTRDEFLFFPANFWQHKNHQMLILAFSKFLHLNSNSDLKLVFSGAPGERMDFLRESVIKAGLDERIIFLGFVSDEEMSALYQACKAMIFPSLFEGFGAPVLEAMSYGKPVLCSNVTSLPEVGGDAVIYFDPRKIESIIEAIQQITTDNALAMELGRRGYDRSKEFGTPGMMAAEYLDILCRVYAEAGQIKAHTAG